MESNLLVAIFALLAASVVLVPLAKISGLGTILGYLTAGVLIGPYGLGLVTDTETILHLSEFGIVMMLFLIGLELQPAELWRMRNKVLGMGLTQLAGTALVIGVMSYLIGFSWQVSTIVGLALAMSSTAIAMQSVASRDITRTDTGRGTLAVLLVQDVAVIPILAAIPLLASMTGSPEIIGEELVDAIENPMGWYDALLILGAFAATLLAGRYLVRPFLHFIAGAGVREAFTIVGLALVVGAALLTQLMGLSPALGAFLGGVLLADSEYRHELQSNLEPFKGLLLGLFFISVGMSIAFNVVVEQPLNVLALVVAVVTIKLLVVFVIATFWRLHMAERVLMAILLSQAGEFAFVLLQFAGTAGLLPESEYALLTAVVAISMATTPLLVLLFDRVLAPRLIHQNVEARAADAIDNVQQVIVLGYGRFGQIVTRMLRGQGFEMTLIDDDPAQIETVRRFGVKVFYGDGGRLDLLHAAGADQARMIVVAVGGRERITSIVSLIRRHFPHVKTAARAVDRAHAHELMSLGVTVFERETFRSALKLGVRALVAMGYDEDHANRLAESFERHDNRLLFDSYALRHDEDAYIGYLRRSVDMLNEVMQADAKPEAAEAKDTGVPSPVTAVEPGTVDNPVR